MSSSTLIIDCIMDDMYHPFESTGCSSTETLCSHERAHELLTYQAAQCQMVAYQCSSYEKFAAGACDVGQPGDSNNAYMFTLLNQPVNFLHDEYDPKLLDLVAVEPSKAELSSSLTNKLSYYVSTGSNSTEGPDTLCFQHYQVKLNVPSTVDVASLFGSDSFSVTLIAEGGTSHEVTMAKQSNTLWTGLLNGGNGEPFVVEEARIKRASSKTTKTTSNSDDSVCLEVQVEFMSSVDPEKRAKVSTILHVDETASSDSVLVSKVRPVDTPIGCQTYLMERVVQPVMKLFTRKKTTLQQRASKDSNQQKKQAASSKST